MTTNITTSIFHHKDKGAQQVTVSERIRQRLIAAGARFYANDNISEFLKPGELDELRDEIESRLQDLLDTLIIDTEHDHNTTETPKRVASMYLDEIFRGRYQPAPAVTTFPNITQLNELMLVGPLTVRSACSHHFCPIMGNVWIGVIPSAKSDLIGLSKYARLCNWIMNRPQIQEEAIVMLADELEKRIHPDGIAVVMEATHYCMHWRGVRDEKSVMTNSVMRGVFRENAVLRREFMDLMKR